MKNTRKHKKVLDETLVRYKTRTRPELVAFYGIYTAVRRDAVKDGDSRWQIPASEDKLSVKEHLKLIHLAIKSKGPVRINCAPAVMGVEPISKEI